MWQELLHSSFWQYRLSGRVSIYQEANQQIVQYSESLASQGAELSKVQGEAEQSGNTAEEVTKQLTEEQTKSKSYEALLSAYQYYQQQNMDEAAVAIQSVQTDVLDDSMKTIYNTIKDATGVAGQEGSSDSQDGSEESTDSGSDEGDGSEDTGDSGDSGNYDDSSYDSGYDEESYDGSYDESYE